MKKKQKLLKGESWKDYLARVGFIKQQVYIGFTLGYSNWFLTKKARPTRNRGSATQPQAEA